MKRLLITVLTAAMLAACGPRQEKGKTVSVSILPERYFVERIAGERVKVNVLLPPGASPASTDLSPIQLQSLYDSQLCFAIGDLPFEASTLYPMLEGKNAPRLIRLSDGMRLEANGHSHLDPHVWMSPKNARGMAEKICSTLSEQFPEEEAFFARNCRQLLAEIDSIDQEARRITATKRHKAFLIYHPALTYFAKDYGMRQVAIEDEGKEPNPTHIKAIINTCRAQGIRIVFIQSQFDTANAATIAREIDGEVVPIDPLAEDWKGEMERLLDIINQKME